MGVSQTISRSGVWAPQSGSMWGPLWGGEGCNLMGRDPDKICTNKGRSNNGGCVMSSMPTWQES